MTSHIKRLALLPLALLISSCSLSNTYKPADGWTSNWETAKLESRASGKPILLNISGSDWCGWCIKLKDEVFETKAFKDYAEDNLVLMEADFPRSMDQPASLQAQNEMLRDRYINEGYPTVWLLDSDGKKISPELGGLGHDPDTWVSKLKLYTSRNQ